MHPAAQTWFHRRTSAAPDWPVERLVERKGGVRVSVVLPALDEEPTVGEIVAGVRRLADRTGLVDEIVVIDSGSVDRTAAVAAAAGATVHHRDDILPEVGSRPGKGEVLWKALQVTAGDIIVYVDADLTDFGEHYVTGLLGPLLTDDSVLMVKAFYDRPLLDVAAAGGGRVTELMARPLLGLLRPELAGVIQPLAGEYAARRSLLEQLPFAAGVRGRDRPAPRHGHRPRARRGGAGRPGSAHARAPGHGGPGADVRHDPAHRAAPRRAGASTVDAC